MEVTDFILHELTDRLLATSGFAARREAVAEWNRSHAGLKRGIAVSPVKFGISFTLTHLNQAGALVQVYRDGSVAVNHGGTEMGQGLHRKVTQVAASRFGLPVERVRITATDTSKVPNTSATAASSGADLNGMAVQNAADAIRDRMAECLARLHQTAPGPGGLRGRDGDGRGRGPDLGRGGGGLLPQPRVALLDRVLRHARPRMGPHPGARAGRSSTSPTARR